MKRIIVIAFCIALIGLPGCKKHPAPTAPEETTPSVEATSAVTEETGTAPAVEPGPTGVHSPAPGDTAYLAIVDAAQEYLRVTGDIVVHQIEVEDGLALLDVEEAPVAAGWRSLLALTRTGDAWTVTFSADAFDEAPQPDASQVPGMTQELLASIQWDRARTSLAQAACTHAAAEAAAQGGFPRSEVQAGPPRLARTSTHEWWASCVVAHESGSIDPLTVYMRWLPDGDGWETFDCGTGIEPVDDPRFPPDVADQL